MTSLLVDAYKFANARTMLELMNLAKENTDDVFWIAGGVIQAWQYGRLAVVARNTFVLEVEAPNELWKKSPSLKTIREELGIKREISITDEGVTIPRPKYFIEDMKRNFPKTYNNLVKVESMQGIKVSEVLDPLWKQAMQEIGAPESTDFVIVLFRSRIKSPFQWRITLMHELGHVAEYKGYVRINIPSHLKSLENQNFVEYQRRIEMIKDAAAEAFAIRFEGEWFGIKNKYAMPELLFGVDRRWYNLPFWTRLSHPIKPALPNYIGGITFNNLTNRK